MLKIHIAPNCSLQPGAALWFFASMCGVSFAIAGAMAWRGLWPILPFAGLDMLLLGWALRASLRRRHHSQTITVTDRQVALETRNGAQCEQFVFPRHWARVTLRRADTPLHPSRLSIESHGRSYEVGGFLTEEERRALAARLLRSVGRMNESPPLLDASTMYRSE
jgi:uncharacterized membrane protein